MIQLIFTFLLLVLSPGSYGQLDTNIVFAEVILSNHGDTIQNTDTITGQGSRMLKISLASDAYMLLEAEFSVLVKRGKAIVYTMSGKGNEISLVDLGVYAQSRDVFVIEIKKLKASNPGIILKPSNRLFNIYLK